MYSFLEWDLQFFALWPKYTKERDSKYVIKERVKKKEKKNYLQFFIEGLELYNMILLMLSLLLLELATKCSTALLIPGVALQRLSYKRALWSEVPYFLDSFLWSGSNKEIIYHMWISQPPHWGILSANSFGLLLKKILISKGITDPIIAS